MDQRSVYVNDVSKSIEFKNKILYEYAFYGNDFVDEIFSIAVLMKNIYDNTYWSITYMILPKYFTTYSDNNDTVR